jgi:hypothetical protein
MSTTTIYPLPRASQKLYTEWFNQKVSRGVLENYTVVWVGQPLSVRFRSGLVKDEIGKQHVFIVRNGDMFEYAVVDNSNTFNKLPKKFYTTCFPSINISNVPPNNVMSVRIAKKTIELPFIPNAFLLQKRQKTSRKKRKVSSPPVEEISSVEHIDYNISYPTWTILDNNDIHGDVLKTNIMILIREIINKADISSHFCITSPFDSIKTLDELKSSPMHVERLKTIISFIYAFCRAELGCFNLTRALDTKVVEEWIEDLKNDSSS